eukprot:TRINITY_DN3018_c0_g1_i1.p1 TRINITY_DN3018_c0_g1~~TRINITY_DN3018_c0_g1_i1.p1  ORF type:complete len:374 (-),score=81.08 TRINITY_DN3018_c0_g1_i1:29-994(-)
MDELIEVLRDILPQLTSSWNSSHVEELRAIANTLATFDKTVTFAHVVLVHLQYELFAGCTSAALQLMGNAAPILVRNMDWEMPALKGLTIDVHFYRKGELLFQSTTWAGYIGVLTASAPGKFAISVNHREIFGNEEEHQEQDIFNVLMLENCLPVAFAVREAMEKCVSFEECVEYLQQVRLLAPTYFITAGVEEGQCSSIVRGPENVVERSEIQNTVIQANMDLWVDNKEDKAYDAESQRRCCVVQEFLNCASASSSPLSSPVSADQLIRLFSSKPLQDDECTIYGTFMCPQTGDYISWIPNPKPSSSKKKTKKRTRNRRS